MGKNLIKFIIIQVYNIVGCAKSTPLIGASSEIREIIVSKWRENG